MASPKVKTVLYGLLILVIIAGAGLASLILWVRHDVRAICAQACQAQHLIYPRQAAQALIAQVQSKDLPCREKNRMVCAMSYLDDPRLSPTLRGLQTGAGKCDHARAICQYEVRKALDKIENKGLATRAVRRLVRP